MRLVLLVLLVRALAGAAEPPETVAAAGAAEPPGTVATPVDSKQQPELAARMSRQDSAWESWDLAARFESGHVLVARFLVTNDGPGEHTAVAVGHLLFPDGSPVTFHNGRASDRWKLEHDGMRLDVGSSELDLRPPRRSYEIDKDRTGVKIHLAIEASPDTSLASRQGPGGYGIRIVDVAAPIEGTAWIRERKMEEPVALRGRASLIHSWADARESKVALRRVDFASLSPDGAISLVDVTTPDDAHLRWLVVQRGGRIVHETPDFELSLGPSQAGSGRYPVPASVSFRDSVVEGKVDLQRILLSRDPFELVPQPFRFLLSLHTRPRRVWAESPFKVKFDTGSDRSSWQAQGAGIATVTWLNPPES